SLEGSRPFGLFSLSVSSGKCKVFPSTTGGLGFSTSRVVSLTSPSLLRFPPFVSLTSLSLLRLPPIFFCPGSSTECVSDRQKMISMYCFDSSLAFLRFYTVDR
uniref:Uncharacterized protein n=1 Tax=Sinocyclocheilus rhinocerous TaxID=307959 RepID=A0A673M189_9TELE